MLGRANQTVSTPFLIFFNGSLVPEGYVRGARDTGTIYEHHTKHRAHNSSLGMSQCVVWYLKDTAGGSEADRTCSPHRPDQPFRRNIKRHGVFCCGEILLKGHAAFCCEEWQTQKASQV